MGKRILVTIAIGAFGLGCATLDRLSPSCRLVLSDSLCDAVDVYGAVRKDIEDTSDAILGDDE